jgi:hypothetical protein
VIDPEIRALERDGSLEARRKLDAAARRGVHAAGIALHRMARRAGRLTCPDGGASDHPLPWPPDEAWAGVVPTVYAPVGESESRARLCPVCLRAGLRIVTERHVATRINRVERGIVGARVVETETTWEPIDNPIVTTALHGSPELIVLESNDTGGAPSSAAGGDDGETASAQAPDEKRRPGDD